MLGSRPPPGCSSPEEPRLLSAGMKGTIARGSGVVSKACLWRDRSQLKDEGPVRETRTQRAATSPSVLLSSNLHTLRLCRDWGAGGILHA